MAALQPGIALPEQVRYLSVAMPEPIIESLFKAFRAAVVFVGHALLAVVLLTGIWGVELYIHYLWGAREPLLFDRLPLKYLFDLADITVLAVFIFWGAYEANEKFRGR